MISDTTILELFDMYYNDDDLCPGCGQKALHKYCPAHGSYFYMSGIPYTPEVHALRKRYGTGVTDAVFKLLRALKNQGIDLEQLKTYKPAEE